MSMNENTPNSTPNLEREKLITVTQPALPPLSEFVTYLEQIWESKWLTNNGQFHQDLEKALQEYLGVKHLCLFANGTLALITALQALRVTGEVITTPFTFAATTHALWWNGITPVFADINPKTMTIDPAKIESAITPKTTAILPVHVYGNPCDIVQIQDIADTYGLKVIYDAAHTFGVKWKNDSVLNFGDLSILSFHATKVFSTIEGGAIICQDESMKKRIDFLKNFGFAGETKIVAPGINAKMNEVQAAYGLLQLKYIDSWIERRREIYAHYQELLAGVPGLTCPEVMPDVQHNAAYFPVLIDAKEYGKTRDELYDGLKIHNIFTRRYFYPLISDFSPYKSLPSATPANLPVATDIAQKVLCLPMYPALTRDDTIRIADLIRRK